MPNTVSGTDFLQVLNSVCTLANLSLRNLNMTALFRSSLQFWQDQDVVAL